MKGSIRKHYHWVIALLMLFELAIYSGILNNVTSLHLIPVTETLGISRGSFSMAYSLRSLLGFFSTLFSGIFFVKFGFRKLAALALLIAAISFVMLGFSQSFFFLCISFLVLGTTEGFCTTAAASRIINTWFISHQGLVLGLVSASTGLGGSLFSIVLSRVIQGSSWRSSYWLSGILIAVTALLMFLLCRDRPGDIGELPFGAISGHGKKPRQSSRDHWVGYDSKEVLRKPTFYLMSAVVFFSGVCTYAAFSVIVPHLQDYGISATDAAAIQSILLLSLAAAKFLCGLASDLVGAKTVNMLCMICGVIGLVLLTQAHSFSIAVIASIFFSIGVVMTTITVPLLSASLFGYRPQGSIIGIVMALVPASSVVTCPVVNMIYDRIGTYSPIFLFVAGIGAAVCLMMAILFILAQRDRKQFEATHQI